MVHVADPMYVLAIAALKELIAQKVCITSSVDFFLLTSAHATVVFN